MIPYALSFRSQLIFEITIIVAMLNIWNNSIQYFHPVLDLSKKVTQMGSEFIDNNQESLYNVQILLHTLKTNEPKAAEN